MLRWATHRRIAPPTTSSTIVTVGTRACSTNHSEAFAMSGLPVHASTERQGLRVPPPHVEPAEAVDRLGNDMIPPG